MGSDGSNHRAGDEASGVRRGRRGLNSLGFALGGAGPARRESWESSPMAISEIDATMSSNWRSCVGLRGAAVLAPDRSESATLAASPVDEFCGAGMRTVRGTRRQFSESGDSMRPAHLRNALLIIVQQGGEARAAQ